MPDIERFFVDEDYLNKDAMVVNVHQLLLSWDTLTMVKQPFLIPFVTHVLRLEKLVSQHIGALPNWRGW